MAESMAAMTEITLPDELVARVMRHFNTDESGAVRIALEFWEPREDRRMQGDDGLVDELVVDWWGEMLEGSLKRFDTVVAKARERIVTALDDHAREGEWEDDD